MCMTKEQREKIDRIRNKKVVANHENRKTLNDMYNRSKLAVLQYMISGLMQGQMAQTNSINQAVNNLIVEADGIKKKAVKMDKKGDKSND